MCLLSKPCCLAALAAQPSLVFLPQDQQLTEVPEAPHIEDVQPDGVLDAQDAAREAGHGEVESNRARKGKKTRRSSADNGQPEQEPQSPKRSASIGLKPPPPLPPPLPQPLRLPPPPAMVGGSVAVSMASPARGPQSTAATASSSTRLLPASAPPATKGPSSEGCLNRHLAKASIAATAAASGVAARDWHSMDLDAPLASLARAEGKAKAAKAKASKSKAVVSSKRNAKTGPPPKKEQPPPCPPSLAKTQGLNNDPPVTKKVGSKGAPPKMPKAKAAAIGAAGKQWAPLPRSHDDKITPALGIVLPQNMLMWETLPGNSIVGRTSVEEDIPTIHQDPALLLHRAQVLLPPPRRHLTLSGTPAERETEREREREGMNKGCAYV